MTDTTAPTVEDEAKTTADLHAAADTLEHDLDHDPLRKHMPALADARDRLVDAVAEIAGIDGIDSVEVEPGPDTELGQAEADRAKLFDPAKFDDPKLELKTPTGQNVDAIVLKLTGKITLDRANPSDVALFKRLRQGGRFDFEIETLVSNDGWTISFDDDGYPKKTTATKTLKVSGLTELDIPA